jgi:hypothetical protein
MLNNFSLPPWFDASNDIKDTLIELWNKSYDELYEEQYVDESFLITDVLRSDLIKLVKLCENEDKEKTFERCVYFNWALCKAARPIIDEHISDGSMYDSILSDLSTWSFTRQFNDEFSNICLPSYRNYLLSEAIVIPIKNETCLDL